MCGRFARKDIDTFLVKVFDIDNLDQHRQTIGRFPLYNVSPTNEVPVVVQDGGRRLVKPMKWWFIPSWSRTGKPDHYATFNARADKIVDPQNRLWHPAFKSRRCIVPVSGFYEWKKTTVKQPYYIYLKDSPVMALAGLWDVWRPPTPKQDQPPTDNAPFYSFAIVTTDPNELMTEIHPRMPVILDPSNYQQWLDPGNHNLKDLEKLLRPFPTELMAKHRAPKEVGKAGYEAPDLVEPAPRDSLF